MKGRVFCAYCGDELKLGARFLRELEAEGVEGRYAPMGYVQRRRSPYGEPLPICDACRKGIEENARQLAEEYENIGTTQSRQVGFVFLLLLLIVAVFGAMEVLFHRVG